MSKKSFSEKAKQLSTFSTMGVDISGIINMEEIYDMEPDSQYEQTLEGKMLEELRNGITGIESEYFFDKLAQIVGTKRVEGIREAVLERLNRYERDSRERYDTRERQTRIMEQQIDDSQLEYGDSKEDKQNIVSEIKNKSSFSYEETSAFMRNVEEDLYDAVEKIEKSMKDTGLSEMVASIVNKYRQRAMNMNDGFYYQFEDLRREIEEAKEVVEEQTRAIENDTEKQRIEQLGMNGEEVLAKYEEFAYITKTLKHGIGVSVVREQDKEKKEKAVWISNRILDKAKSTNNKEIFDEADLYVFETPDTIRYFTQSEHEKMKAKEQEKQKDKEDISQSQELPEFFG
ncbi:MAG: hypothetical protein IJ220_02585 [Clostridia bacterium]|nr:hypothetical protein [Clostridia bacterium]